MRLMATVDGALARLKKGGMLVVYDGEGREGEADLVFCARFATPEKVELLRKDAGGLICAAISKAAADSIGLPFYVDLLTCGGLGAMACRRTAYGEKPAFSISVNHRGVFTGITDNDRALTLRKLDEVVRAGTGDPERKAAFIRQFYSPGHVPLLIGRGIANRRGHTELSLELAAGGGMDGVMVLCEMLGKGNALPKEKARTYARRNGLPFIEGKELVGK